MAENNNPQDFAEKVLQSLKKQARAVDLTDDTSEENVVEQASVQPFSQDFTAYGSQIGGGQGPGSGGNKDLVVVPGYGGTAATSTSQINFYWNAPAVPDSTGVDNNVRATIFNYATSATNPVLVIGGYNGTSQFKPHPTYGGGTGVTAKILIDPFLGRIDVDQIGLNSTGVGVSTYAGILTYDTAQSRLRVGLSGIAKTVAFTDDIPVISGFATTARNIDLASGANNASHFLTFSLTSTGSGVALSSDADLTYNPSTNTLSAVTFSGALSGTATTSQNVNLAAGANATNHSVVFSLNATGSGVALSSDAGLQYNPSTNVLTADVFSGNFTGTAATATNFYGTHVGNVTGNVTGFATTAQNVNVVSDTTASGSLPLVFTQVGTQSGAALSTNMFVTITPSQNKLTATLFSGTSFSGIAMTASTGFFGALTGNVTGTATTAQNVNVAAATSAGAHYLLIAPAASGSGLAVSTDASLSYVPTTDTLTVSNIFGSGAGLTLSASAALTNNSYLTIQTVAGDDASTSDYFIRGITSAATSKFSVDANGNLRATTKSFDIDHPTKPGKRLVYGVLEGPEHGVYHRGTVEGKGNLLVELPDYWNKLVNEDYTVTLTTHGNYSVHIVEKSLNSFIIGLTGPAFLKMIKPIKVDYLVHGSRKDAPLIIEQDDH